MSRLCSRKTCLAALTLSVCLIAAFMCFRTVFASIPRISALSAAFAASQAPKRSFAMAAKPTDVYGFKALDIDNNELVQLHEKYAEQGLAIIAFPCNQFGGQEPGSAEDIKKFVAGYNVQFKMMAKIDVNGKDAHPLWKYLENTLPGFLGLKDIKWNFSKFLVNKQGVPVKRYGPQEEPNSMIKEIEKLLKA